MLKRIYREFIEALEIIFLTWIRDIRTAFRVPKLLRVEWELFYRYLLNFPPLFIHLERGKYRYPANNFYFGEIPHRVTAEIAETCSITEADVVYDLGSGRGKVVFCLHLMTKARCIGVDLISRYIDISTAIAEKMKMNRVWFFHEDVAQVDLSTATVVIAHCSCFSPATHEAIADSLNNLKPGSWFVTTSISYDHPLLELVEKKEYLLSWGRTEMFFYRIRSSGFSGQNPEV